MHGLGNDFVIIDGRAFDVNVSQGYLRALADRKRGIGCDQFVILREPASESADVFLEMYNADGSSLRACGNATRCVAQLMFTELNKSECVIETVAGLLPAWQESSDLIGMDFGEPRLDWEAIPLSTPADTLSVPLSVGGLSNPCCVNVGNPHAVFFVADVRTIDLATVGPILENDDMFPDRCNIEVAQVIDRDRVRMRVWERGTGITEACGSGAAATLVAAVRRMLSDTKATIMLDGGELIVEWRPDNHVFMTGPASFSFAGDLGSFMGPP